MFEQVVIFEVTLEATAQLYYTVENRIAMGLLSEGLNQRVSLRERDCISEGL